MMIRINVKLSILRPSSVLRRDVSTFQQCLNYPIRTPLTNVYAMFCNHTIRHHGSYRIESASLFDTNHKFKTQRMFIFMDR